MIENPFETIASEPPETEKSEGALAPRGSVIPIYQCPHCEGIFGINEFTQLRVYFGVQLIDCPCGCARYSYSDGLYEEKAWKCPNGCFHHDVGDSPLGYERYRNANCYHLHGTKKEARDCLDFATFIKE